MRTLKAGWARLLALFFRRKMLLRQPLGWVGIGGACVGRAPDGLAVGATLDVGGGPRAVGGTFSALLAALLTGRPAFFAAANVAARVAWRRSHYRRLTALYPPARSWRRPDSSSASSWCHQYSPAPPAAALSPPVLAPLAAAASSAPPKAAVAGVAPVSSAPYAPWV